MACHSLITVTAVSFALALLLAASADSVRPPNTTTPDTEEGTGSGRWKRAGAGGIIDILNIGVSTCIRFSGGSNCRKTCQGIMEQHKKKCYCTGSCEWSWLVLTCRCKDPSCGCGPG